MKLGIAFTLLLASATHAEIIYNQPSNSTGTLYQSAWWDPDGSDYDYYIWDSFVLTTDQMISEIHWRGGFLYGGSFGGPVIDFTVAIYPSIAANTEPDVVHPPLVEYQTGGDAGQTFAGVVNGTTMYDYAFVLPATFSATAGTKYWVHIVAWQHGIPEWGFASASGGNGAHFRRHSEYMFQMVPGDCAFSLISPTSVCPADLDHDGAVNIVDLLAVVGQWGQGGGSPPDINGDGAVNIVDLLAVIGAWGACP